MSAPQQFTKGPKRSARKNKIHAAPIAAQGRGTVSENELSHAPMDSSQENKGSRGKPHTNVHANKKPNGTSGHTSDAMPDRSKATPVKPQAYAGATFTNSPAPSALPIPSFYSKSVPNVSHGPPQPTIPEQDSRQATPIPARSESPNKRESTPLDFLFAAARGANGTPRGGSPSARPTRLPAASHSPASGSPAPRDTESVFPFELDGATTPGEDGSSFATPFKERMEALQTTRPTSNGVRGLSETERQEKSAALKKFLIKESTPSPPSHVEPPNPFNARAPQPRTNFDAPNGQPRPRSNPSTPRPYTPNGYVPGTGPQYLPTAPQFPQYAPNSGYRQTSNLRNHYDVRHEPEVAELSSDSAITPPRISTARKSSVPAMGPEPVAYGHPQAPVHRSKPSIQQMEDQMRNFLKLDLTSKG